MSSNEKDSNSSFLLHGVQPAGAPTRGMCPHTAVVILFLFFPQINPLFGEKKSNWMDKIVTQTIG